MSVWADMPASAVAAAAGAGAVALWPIGATEQHGRHLGTGFDIVAASTVCNEVDRRLGAAVVVLPGMPFGASDHWMAFGGTLSLRPETLAQVVSDVLRSVEKAGFRSVVVVNGHHGNTGALLTALGTPRSGLRVEAVNYWDLVDAAQLAGRCAADAGGIGHAGEIETSIALHLGGLVVDELAAGTPLGDGPGSGRATYLRSPRATDIPTGVLGDPRPANAELGAWLIQAAATALGEHCLALRSEAAA